MNTITNTWDRYKLLRYQTYCWLYHLAASKKICLSFAMAFFTGLCAQIKINLGFTPVPITGQVLAVLLSGVILGSKFGAFSQLMYLSLGIAGIPWFAGFTAGSSILMHPSCGYIIGFIFAAAFIGWSSERSIKSRKLLWQFALMLVGVGIIYFFGVIYLSIIIHTNLKKALLLGALPFIPLDLIKAVIAAHMAALLLPKASYNGEIDKSKYPEKY